MIASKSFRQKQKVTVSIQPQMPETRIAARMATGPRMAASTVSSDMLHENVREMPYKRDQVYILGCTIIICHCPCNR